jgi:hypothetical protein
MGNDPISAYQRAQVLLCSSFGSPMRYEVPMLAEAAKGRLLDARQSARLESFISRPVSFGLAGACGGRRHVREDACI